MNAYLINNEGVNRFYRLNWDAVSNFPIPMVTFVDNHFLDKDPMHLNKLSLVNFKNYADTVLDLHPKLNCFVGNNGVGKTNLLDAIYYLCVCKSYFNVTDAYSIKTDEDYMLLQGEFIRKNKKEEIQCGLQRDKKKQFKRNKKDYERLSDHVGLLPVVMVSPADIQLIVDGSEERRKYINGVISQYNRNYLDNTMKYNKVLSQRNRLLKDLKGKNTQKDLLDIFDDQLIETGQSIYQERKHFIEKFIPVFAKYYSFISDGSESVELVYHSQLHVADFNDLLKNSRTKDLTVQFTTVGIHRDDLVLHLEGIPIRKIGSQGQQKTYLVSLKLAQFEFLKEVKGILPVLLLDDVFDKFDANRVKQILKLVGNEAFGQIFITHTNLDRMTTILNELAISHKLFQVKDNQVKEIQSTH
jgi:DNA replication and repair protein RecF